MDLVPPGVAAEPSLPVEWVASQGLERTDSKEELRKARRRTGTSYAAEGAPQEPPLKAEFVTVSTRLPQLKKIVLAPALPLVCHPLLATTSAEDPSEAAGELPLDPG